MTSLKSLLTTAEVIVLWNIIRVLKISYNQGEKENLIFH